MANYNKVQTLSTSESAYIAGLIDGEGTITLTQEHKNERRRLVVSISSTERSLLDFVQAKSGVGTISNKRSYSEHHTPSYVYKVTNRQALELLRQIEPYMLGYKAERAKYALEHYLVVTPRNGRYTPEQLQHKEQFEQSLLNILPNH